MTKAGHPLKLALRNKMKSEIFNKITLECRKQQSDAITRKVIATKTFQNANKISIFLSKPSEVDTIPLLEEIFKQNKQVFIPVYTKDKREMVRLYDMADYESLPITKQNIKQPRGDENRESALETGGIDLFFVPGMAFTPSGGRLGYGMGFYDLFFHRYFDKYPERSPTTQTLHNDNQVVLMALAFKEQIISEDQLPLEEHDIKIDYIVTEDNFYETK